MARYVSLFETITAQDGARFGGKNSSLGQMIHDLSACGVRVPSGFAVSAAAYQHHVETNNLMPIMREIMGELGAGDITDLTLLADVGMRLRRLVASKPLSPELQEEIVTAYRELSQRYGVENCDVAVRSSATAEDSPEASFAGQHESFLHIQGEKDLLSAYSCCLASLFTDRAIVYRRQNGFGDFAVAMSVGVQKMVRSDKAVAGVMFTLDPETGFRDVVTIAASYGLGELVVQGAVNTDEFVVHKPTYKKGFPSIVREVLGSKLKRMVYREARRYFPDFLYTAQERLGSASGIVHELLNPAGDTLDVQITPEAEQQVFCLTDPEVLELAGYACAIEDLYSALRGGWCPMDIEWAKDGLDGKIYVVQARPETVFGSRPIQPAFITYQFATAPTEDLILATGQAIGYGIVSGTARIVEQFANQDDFNDGDILVADMTDPDWIPLLRRAGAIVTNRGGRTCHAAIVSRELGIPAIIGTGTGTQNILDNSTITVDCSSGTMGNVYSGAIEFTRRQTELAALKEPPVPLMVNLGDPDSAFRVGQLPVDGVGLARLEFIISSLIGVHPMACAAPDAITDSELRREITNHLGGEPADWADCYVEKLVSAIACIAAGFYPRPVIVRSTDFKTNEYRRLLGGALFEPEEENPMLGFRGAARYADPSYAAAFALECRAFKRVREELGFKNIKILVPFVRSVTEAQRVVTLFAANGLVRGVDGLEILMMVEVPVNVFLLKDFAAYFDGFSIGSNDLTQLILGVDRDSALVSNLYSEQSPAVSTMISMALSTAREINKPMGICGQAPSDHPEMVDQLVAGGISYISLTPDTVLPFLVATRAGL